MTKHTYGPWKVQKSESKPAWNVVSTAPGSRYKVARCPYMQLDKSPEFNKLESEEAEANARLIACAPDLLDLLNKIVIARRNGQEIPLPEIESIIKKATA